MIESWISLASIPDDGITFTVDDPAFWQSAINEFAIDCSITTPLKATITVLPQEEGILFQGKLQGEVTLPCNRCTQNSHYVLEQKISSFEGFPRDPFMKMEQEDEEELLPAGDESVIRQNPQGHGIEINPSALAWQEFALFLPINPLCSENCKGLCPACGCDKNTENCGCIVTVDDPRMAPLRGLVIKK